MNEPEAIEIRAESDVAPAPAALTPGQVIMRSQRAYRKRLVPLQHAFGQPIRLKRMPPEQYRALRKAFKKFVRGRSRQGATPNA
jgi:hypothetical protein